MLARNWTWPGISIALALAATALPAQYRIWQFHGNSANDQLGYAVAGAGDVDGDGHDDVIVGAWWDDPNGTNSGSAYVYSGRTGMVLHTFHGDSQDDSFGCGVAGAGDVNGDGFADVIIGARFDDDIGAADCGSARVYSGLTGAVLHTFFGDATGDWFGWSLAGAGDVDADGYDDLFIGAHRNDVSAADAGLARVYSGRTGGVIHTFYGDSAGDHLGYSVASAGDVDADGFVDLIAGARFNGDNGARAGLARVYSGRTGGALRTFRGASAGDWFGESVNGAGDVDGDGHDDVIIGAVADDNPTTDCGSAFVYSGRTWALLRTFAGDSASDYMGCAVDGAGDVDGDGFDDLIVGAYGDDDFGGYSGSIRIFSGHTGTALRTLYGAAAGDYFGFRLAGIGDVDADGFSNFVVAAPYADPNGGQSGSAFVLRLLYTGTPAHSREFGSACPGSNLALPHIGIDGRPALGTAPEITLRAALPTTTAVFLLGLPQAIPLDLIGMTGCTQYASAISLLLVGTDSNGMGRTPPLLVPNVPALLGGSATSQWVCFDPTANSFGLTTSNGLVLYFGT